MLRSAFIAIGIYLFLIMGNAYAVDSYRFLHVTIETPWMIFIFLLFIVLSPFVLAAILYWYYAAKKSKPNESD